VDARVLELAAYDLILGMDWLEHLRPMTCDWLLKWIEFEHQGTMVRLQGILPQEDLTVSEISGEQMHKWAKGNDISALVAIIAKHKDENKMEQYLVNGIPAEIQQVIHEYSDLFQTPTSLPPSIIFDHGISIVSPIGILLNRKMKLRSK
jgi:hypothetical protein